jgi:hypothetical protein
VFRYKVPMRVHAVRRWSVGLLAVLGLFAVDGRPASASPANASFGSPAELPLNTEVTLASTAHDGALPTAVGGISTPVFDGDETASLLRDDLFEPFTGPPPKGTDFPDVLQGSVDPSTSAEPPRTCTKLGTQNNGITYLDEVVHYVFTGTGAPVTVSTRGGTSFETLVAVWPESRRPRSEDCFDGPFVDGSDAVTIPTRPGARYRVAVGGCDLCDEAVPRSGALTIGAFTGGVSDDLRAGSERTTLVEDERELRVDTRGATEQPGEPLTCGGRTLGRTAWFRIALAEPGRIRVETRSAIPGRGVDTVLRVIPVPAGQGDPAKLPAGTCNDDDPAVGGGGSRVETVLTVRGEVLVQVGGAAVPGGLATGRPFDAGLLDVRARVLTIDRDGDGVPPPADCDDTTRKRRPGVLDRPGNGVDEDCDGEDAPRRFGPEVNPRLVRSAAARGRVRLTSLEVDGVPVGTTVRATFLCSGCPRSSARLTRRKAPLRLRGLAGKRVPARTRYELRIVRRGYLGVVLRQRLGGRRTVSCLQPGSFTRTRRC